MTYYGIFGISVDRLMEYILISAPRDASSGHIGRPNWNARIEMNTDIETYHCPKCNKEFLDKELANDHQKSTGHKIRERILEK
jgi:hypothetical protein